MRLVEEEVGYMPNMEWGVSPCTRAFSSLWRML